MATNSQATAPSSKALWPRVLVIGAILGIVGLVSARVANNPGRVEAVVPSGTTFVGALQATVSTEHSSVGDRVELKTTDPVALDGESTLPVGLVLRGEVTHAAGGGRISGAPELTIRFTRLEIDGEDHAITAEPFRVKGKSDAKESALEIGGGTVVGGVVGAVTGNVVRGAVVGAILGTGVAIATEGDHIVLPVGQKLRVRLSDPVTVSFKPHSAEGTSQKP